LMEPSELDLSQNFAYATATEIPLVGLSETS
jgi:hypothetical protein